VLFLPADLCVGLKKREKEKDKKEREAIIRGRERIIDRFVQQGMVRLKDRLTLPVM
jgi:hypothetical protein